MDMEIRDLMRNTICSLADSGIENAGFEARQILEFAGLDRMKMLTEPAGEVPDPLGESVERLVEKRVSGYPLQYLLGEWEFYGLPFKVGEGVLIPRQDTETLAETALDFLKTLPESERTALDLCAGSGCLGITLAKLASARVTLVEKSDKALGFLRENIALNGVSENCRAVLGDVLDERADLGGFGGFSVIVSNPPYLTKAEMERLQREVRYEPEMALYGGEDGLDLYKKLLPKYVKSLKPNGLFAVEIGDAQAREVMRIFLENGLDPEAVKDSAGFCRVVYAIKQV